MMVFGLIGVQSTSAGRRRSKSPASNIMREIRKMSLASQDAKEEKKKAAAGGGGGGTGTGTGSSSASTGTSSAASKKAAKRLSRRRKRREEEYTDKVRLSLFEYQYVVSQSLPPKNYKVSKGKGTYHQNKYFLNPFLMNLDMEFNGLLMYRVCTSTFRRRSWRSFRF